MSELTERLRQQAGTGEPIADHTAHLVGRHRKVWDSGGDALVDTEAIYDEV